jgi:exopolysaccharide production protein ExoZ
MKLNNLQILRGISALLVCCFHFRESINFDHLKLGQILFGKGSIGVPIFFVISGFIMTFTTKNFKFSPERGIKKSVISFYKKRIVRIVPLYYLLTLSWMIIGGTFFMYFSGDLWNRFIHSILFLPQKDSFPVLYLGWSLNYEMFFYLIFGISLLFKNHRYYFIIAFFILSYLIGLFFKFENAFYKMATDFLNFYFISGIILALLLQKFKIPRKQAFFFCIGGILLFSFYFFRQSILIGQFLSLVIISFFVLSFLLLDFSFHLKGNRFLIFLGDISYSLYLSHPFVEILFRHFKIEGYLNIPYLVLKLIVVIGVAAFFYYVVEKKFTDYLKIKFQI